MSNLSTQDLGDKRSSQIIQNSFSTSVTAPRRTMEIYGSVIGYDDDWREQAFSRKAPGVLGILQ